MADITAAEHTASQSRMGANPQPGTGFSWRVSALPSAFPVSYCPCLCLLEVSLPCAWPRVGGSGSRVDWGVGSASQGSTGMSSDTGVWVSTAVT